MKSKNSLNPLHYFPPLQRLVRSANRWTSRLSIGQAEHDMLISFEIMFVVFAQFNEYDRDLLKKSGRAMKIDFSVPINHKKNILII